MRPTRPTRSSSPRKSYHQPKQATVLPRHSLALAKAKVCATADFEKDELVFQGSVCVRKWWGGWKCRTFRLRALAW